MKRITCMMIVAALMTVTLCACARAEEDTSQTLYILCMPDSEVNVRSRSTTDSEIIGRLYCGDVVIVDHVKGRWAYVTGISIEAGAGWVHCGYITDGVVTQGDQAARIDANGRVRSRKSIDGDTRSWLRPGDGVTIYAKGGSWAITNVGFVKTEFLQEEEK